MTDFVAHATKIADRIDGIESSVISGEPWNVKVR